MLLLNSVCALVLLAFTNSVASAHDDHGATSESEVAQSSTIPIRNGQRIELDLHALCLALSADCDGMLHVITAAEQGLLLESSEPMKVRYQHAGVSMSPESLAVASVSETGDSHIVYHLVLTPTVSNAEFKIVSPIAGEIVTNGRIEFVATAQGSEIDHVHVSLTNDSHLSIPIANGVARYVFENIEAGQYQFTASLADDSHRVIPGTEVVLPVTVSQY